MVGLDRRTLSKSDALRLAQQVVDGTQLQLREGLTNIRHDVDPETPVVLSGHGSDLLEGATASKVIELSEQ